MESNIRTKTIKYKFLISIFLVLFSVNSLFAGNSFVKSKIRQAELKLYFASEIERVTYFTLPTKEGYTKYVFDIHGATLPDDKGISHHTFRTIKSFRIAQNSEEKLRVVIISKEKGLDKHHNYDGKVLAIPLVGGQESTITKEKKKEAPSYSSKNRKYIVVIDAGHGGKDNGASCDEKKEKNVVFSVAQKLQKKLKARGYTVYMTRTTDTFVKLPKRTEFANEKKADIFVSIHANAAPKKTLGNVFKGIEVYYLSPANSLLLKHNVPKRQQRKRMLFCLKEKISILKMPISH